MINTMILVSGMPATGKTTFAKWLASEICAPLVSRGRVIEMYLEVSGANFEDEEQRRALGHIPSGLFWLFCEEIMKSSSPLIMEYIFNNQMKEEINRLTEKYKYQTINVHFDTSIEVAHRRFHERSESNPGVKGARPKEIPFENFEKGTKEIKNFRYGERIIYVDTTDFSTVSYKDIVEQIHKFNNF